MRKSAYDIVVDVWYSMDPDKPYSLNKIAKENKITWRTARNAVNALIKLGLISPQDRNNGGSME